MGKCKLFNTQYCHLASLVAQRVKRLPAMQETRFDPWVRKIRWRRKWQPTPVLLPGKSHGWRSLIGYSPWCPKESDTTEQLHFHFYCHLEKIKFYPYNKINPRWLKDLKHKQAQEKKNSLTTLIILEIQIKTMFRYLLSTYQIIEIRKTDDV